MSNHSSPSERSVARRLAIAALLLSGAFIAVWSFRDSEGPIAAIQRERLDTTGPIADVRSPSEAQRAVAPSQSPTRADSVDSAPGVMPAPRPASDDFSPEEIEVLREHPNEEVGALIARAEYAYQSASARSRPEAKRRYHMLLNLAAKLNDAPAPPVNVRERELQEQYLEIEGSLGPAEREAFKAEFFREVLEDHQEKEGRHE